MKGQEAVLGWSWYSTGRLVPSALIGHTAWYSTGRLVPSAKQYDPSEQPSHMSTRVGTGRLVPSTQHWDPSQQPSHRKRTSRPVQSDAALRIPHGSRKRFQASWLSQCLESGWQTPNVVWVQSCTFHPHLKEPLHHQPSKVVTALAC